VVALFIRYQFSLASALTRKVLCLLVLSSALPLSYSAWADETPSDLVVEKVLVIKSERSLQLLVKGEVYRQYNIALGDNPVGHKQKEGDERTPEGNYVIDYRNPQSRFHLSLHISYPNSEDKQQAKLRGVNPGGDIFIHGMPKSAQWLGAMVNNLDWTDGCIAVSNSEMEEIWALVKNGTPIEIRP